MKGGGKLPTPSIKTRQLTEEERYRNTEMVAQALSTKTKEQIAPSEKSAPTPKPDDVQISAESQFAALFDKALGIILRERYSSHVTAYDVIDYMKREGWWQ